MTGLRTSTLALVAALAAGTSFAQGPAAPAAPAAGQAAGQAVFERACADCHVYAPEDDRAPSLDALRRMSAGQIRAALTGGLMAAIGEQLSPDEVREVAAWLGAPEGATPSR